MLCAKCRVQIRTILGSFCAKSEDGTNSHFAHNMSYQMYGAVCSIQTHKWVVMVILVRERRRRGEGLAWGWEMSWAQVGSDGDLGEGEEEEGGGAGLGMGDVLGGVVTLDVTVGGARCECV